MGKTCGEIEEKSEIAVSVIVPAFNVSEYIGECIESILEQTIDNIELILIDDCSDDNTVDVIKRYMANYAGSKNIILLENNSNMGAGYSRNRGIDVANGRYLAFLDSDDFFERTMLEKLFKKSEEANADIAICNFSFYDNQDNIYIPYQSPYEDSPKYYEKGFKLDEICMYAFQFMKEMAWNKLFKRKFVEKNNIRFQCQHNANDQFFVFGNMLKADKIIYVRDYLMFYRIHKKNQLSVSISKDPMCIWNATKATMNYLFELNKYSIYKKSFNTYIIYRLLFSLKKVEEDKRSKLLKFYKEKGYEDLKIKKCNFDDFIVPSFYEIWKELVKADCMENIEKIGKWSSFWESDKFDELLRSLYVENNLVLWGAGKRGERFLKRLDESGIKCRAVIDRDEKKNGLEIIQGYIVRGMEYIQDGDYIIVLNPDHVPTILNQTIVQKKKITLLDARAYLCFNIEYEQAVIRNY